VRTWSGSLEDSGKDCAFGMRSGVGQSGKRERTDGSDCSSMFLASGSEAWRKIEWPVEVDLLGEGHCTPGRVELRNI
jgi:hypothetical protein